VASGTEAYYSFDFGNAHFVVLDSFESSRETNGTQFAWLEQDLAANTSDWLIAIWHHPPYSKGSHDSDDATHDPQLIDMRENFLPLLESHGVDLVMGGHSHLYERSHLLHEHYGDSGSFHLETHAVNHGDGDASGDGAYMKATSGPYMDRGSVYVVAGSSGKISGLQPDYPHPAMQVNYVELGSAVLDISSNRLDVIFLNSGGVVRDDFTLLNVDVGPGDSDGDGLPDTWEQFYFFNPTNALISDDPDGDGYDNLSEFISSTHPNNNLSVSNGADHVIVPFDSTWNYLDDGSDQGTNWVAPAFDDSAWASGPAEFGYGDGDEATVVNFGPNDRYKYRTTYFRKAFQATNTATARILELRTHVDDGAVFYINGTEVYRQVMPNGVISYMTYANENLSELSGGQQRTYRFPSDLLVDGENVIAVEVHLEHRTSDDLSFNMELVWIEDETILRGPYLQQAADDEMTIRWRSLFATTGTVYYGTSSASLTNSLMDAGSTNEHEIRLTGLDPDTTYYYQLNDGTNVLVTGTNYFFQTAPATGSGNDLRIWVLGDSGTHNDDARDVYSAYTNFNGNQYTDLMLMLGDNAYYEGTDSEFQTALFDMYPGMLRQTPLYSCFGNHDGRDYPGLTSPYFALHTFPTNAECGGVASGTEAYFSFDYGNVHVLSLDSFASSRSTSGPMYTWLAQDLAANTSDWLIAIFHHPPYSKGSHNSDYSWDSDGSLKEMRERFVPLLESYGVDLVLGGHSHSYERSYLMHEHYGKSDTFHLGTHAVNSGDGQETGDGVYMKATSGPYVGEGAVYTVAGASGKISGFPHGGFHPAMVTSLNELGSVVLDVSSNRMDVTYLRSDGAVPDHFTLLKVDVDPGDADGDGLPNTWEQYYFCNPTNALTVGDVDGDGYDNLSEFVAGTHPNNNLSVSSSADHMVVPFDSVWNYLDDGSNQGTSWTAPAFDDSSWSNGAAELGYGDGDEATVVSYGPNQNNKYITTYFRKEFLITNAASYRALELRTDVDDGAVVYINGTEVFRRGLPNGAITYTTLATDVIEGSNEARVDIILADELVDGTNIIAVEVHQNTITSSDVSFNLEMVRMDVPTLLRGPYLQQATDNEMTIRWRSNFAHTGTVYYGVSPGSLTNSMVESSEVVDHVVELAGLNADTTYYYQLNDGTNVLVSGTNYFFQTAPVTGSADYRRIWVLGDSGTGDNNAKAVYEAYTNFNGNQYTDLMLMLGDNAYNSGTDEEYQDAVFDIYPEMLRQTPWFSCYGNHDGFTAESDTQTGPYYDIFTHPTNAECGGVASGTEAYYSMDYGNVHILSLDSFETDRSTNGAMYAWLAQDLAANTSDWLVAIWHHPPYTKGSHDSDNEDDGVLGGGRAMPDMRENFLPLLESYGVDLVLSGHSHSYERSYLLHEHYDFSETFHQETHVINSGDGQEAGDGAYMKATSGPYIGKGAVYTVAGSSGKTSTMIGTHPAMISSLEVLGSLVLDVASNRLDVTFLKSDETVPDSFTLLKVDVGPGDSDGDGLPDTWEQFYFFNPTNAVITGDADGDGYDNLSEYLSGTHPNNNLSVSNNAEHVVVPFDTTWSYLDDGSELSGTNWTSAAYSVTSWSNGVAALGYGTNSPNTVVSYGPESTDKYITTYFRKTFQATNAVNYRALELRTDLEDGAVIYINGTEAVRQNMPAGAVSNSVPALLDAVTETQTYVVPAEALVDGSNTIAVEVHLAATNSADLSFNLELVRTDEASLSRGPYLQQVCEEGITVRWRTDIATTGTVYYGTSSSNLTNSVSEAAAVTDHVVELSGLNSDTTYYYQLNDGTNVLVTGTNYLFQTAPVSGSDTARRIWVLGDAGSTETNGIFEAYTNYTGSTFTDLMLTLGNPAGINGTDAEYQLVFDQYPDFIGRTPWHTTVGTTTGAYYDVMTVPTNAQCGGVASGTEAYYSFDYGNAHFISLDSSGSSRATSGAMYAWLAADLAANSSEWLVALWHDPVHSKGSRDSDVETESIEMRENFLPLLESYGVDLVINARSQSYERSYLLHGYYSNSASFVSAEHTINTGPDTYVIVTNGPYAQRGSAYIVAGSSGQTNAPTGLHPAIVTNFVELGSVVLDVASNQMDVVFLNAAGSVQDTFTLLKIGVGAGDSDGDGLSDAWEQFYFNNPTNALTIGDGDGDGYDNLSEFLAGTHPNNSLSVSNSAEHVIVPFDATWNYLDDGSDLSNTNWTTLAFDDGSWSAGLAALGYGTNTPATVVSYGPDSTNKFITTYFRKTFLATNAVGYRALTLRTALEDGAVINLNGMELLRQNMPAGSISNSVLASSDSATGLQTYILPAGVLSNGTNILAVEVHLAATNSADLSFNLELVRSDDITLTRGPYLQNAAADEMTVRWRTDIASTGSVYYGVSSTNLINSVVEASAVTDHETVLTNLSADTTYYYSVNDGANVLASGTNIAFLSAPAAGSEAPRRIWVLGDAGSATNNAVYSAYTNYTGSTYTDLLLTLGQTAGTNSTDDAYQTTVFNRYADLLAQTPWYASPGNTTGAYYDVHSLPTNSSGTEAYYSFDYGNAHFVSLDSANSSRATNGAMYAWLVSDLASNTSSWLIAVWNDPVHSKGSVDSDAETASVEMRENFLPLLESNGVDLVINSGSHSYERSYLLNGYFGNSTNYVESTHAINAGDGQESGDGTYYKACFGSEATCGAVYIVAGSSGQTNAPMETHPAMYTNFVELGSVVLDVASNRLDAVFLNAAGSIRDNFTLVKIGMGPVDSDMDGMPDAWELFHFGHPTSGVAGVDSDGDGLDNLGEYIAGTLPWDAASVLAIETMLQTNGTLYIVWPSTADRTYSVVHNANLLSNSWITVTNGLPATIPTNQWAPNSLTNQAFYRIDVEYP